jgi:secreted trypsin-like serine protease
MRQTIAVAVAIGVLAVASTNPAAAQARPDNPSIEIVGGERAKIGEFPWVVRLSTGCAGTLIRPGYVLTAAHCAGGGTRRTTSIVATAGSEDLASPGAADVRSQAVVRAQGFRSVTEGNDWAVVRLARQLDLPVVELSGGTTSEGFLTAVGWGSTRDGSEIQRRRLRRVEVPFVPDGTCSEFYREEGYEIIASDMLCAGDTEDGGKDACQGDSGSPLLRRDEDRWVQVGIVSWGMGCGRKAYPGVYTEVSHFVEFIRQAIE